MRKYALIILCLLSCGVAADQEGYYCTIKQIQELADSGTE